MDLNQWAFWASRTLNTPKLEMTTEKTRTTIEWEREGDTREKSAKPKDEKIVD